MTPPVADVVEHALPATERTAPTTMQQAFEAAKVEHSKPSEPDPTQQPAKPADAPIAQAQEPETNPQPALISDEEYAQLSATHGNDPDKLRKELNRVFTQKTQALAESRKSVEAYADLIEAYQSDPIGTISALGQEHGLSFAPAESAPSRTAATIADAMAERVTQELGPDLSFMAEPLTRAMRAVAEETARAVTDEAVNPLRQHAAETVDRFAQEQTQSVMKSFTESHPDWQTHEAKMVDLGSKLNPAGMSELEYLDLLYTVATKDTSAAEAAKRAVKRMQEGARTAESRAESVSETRITKTPPKLPTLRESFEAAKRGERFERA